MDGDLQLDPDPFEGDPEALLRWTRDCVAIERAIRAALTSSEHPDLRPCGERVDPWCESGVFPAVGRAEAAPESDALSGASAGRQAVGFEPAAAAAASLDDDTFDGFV